MIIDDISTYIAPALFVAMALCVVAGRRIGIHRSAIDPEGAKAGTGVVDAAVFALLGLLIAFTFSGAAARYESRRQMIVDETNAIGTAWLRIDLMPDGDQPAMHAAFREYLDSRIMTYELAKTGLKPALEEFAHSQKIQNQIWGQAIAASENGGTQAMTMQLLPALNQMFDITTTRTAMILSHPPTVIYFMLFCISCLGALLAGYGLSGGKTTNWFYMISFAFIISLTVFVILDLEFPRRGFITIEKADQLLANLRQSME